MPMAASRLMAPVEMAAIFTRGESDPIRMMDPLPSCFSIWVMARFSAFRFSASCLSCFWSSLAMWIALPMMIWMILSH